MCVVCALCGCGYQVTLGKQRQEFHPLMPGPSQETPGPEVRLLGVQLPSGTQRRCLTGACFPPGCPGWGVPCDAQELLPTSPRATPAWGSGRSLLKHPCLRLSHHPVPPHVSGRVGSPCGQASSTAWEVGRTGLVEHGCPCVLAPSLQSAVPWTCGSLLLQLWLLSSEPFGTFCPCHSRGERIATWRSHLGPCPGGGELTKGLPQSCERDIVPECGRVAAGGAEGGSAPPLSSPWLQATVSHTPVRVPQDISLAMGLIMRVGVLASNAICYCSPWTSRTPLLMGYNLMLLSLC